MTQTAWSFKQTEGLKMLGLPINNKTCEDCLKGKSTRKKFNHLNKHSKLTGDFIHIYIAGSVNPSTLEGDTFRF